MPRLALQAKLPAQKVDRIAKRDDHSYIPTNDPSNFNLLKDNRCEYEKFSRVDKFRVNHYYQVGTEWLREVIFYPSNEGFEEIDTEKNHFFKKQSEQLVKQGIGLHGERSIPKINKPIKRVELKAKSKRMNLTCKEE